MTLRWVPGWNGLNEPEAVSYVAAVEAADGQELEFGVARAINDFVTGCKQDKIWDAIKACCILAGARTLNGALVPLVGTAPTKNGTEGGWNYNRETGLEGNGTDNYLDSNRAGDDDPQQNNHHVAAYSTSTTTNTGVLISDGIASGSTELILTNAPEFRTRNRSTSVVSHGVAATYSGFFGSSRSSAANYVARADGIDEIETTSSQEPPATSKLIFARSGPSNYTNARLAFYSIGESLDLAALDTRVSNLITAIGAAIP